MNCILVEESKEEEFMKLMKEFSSKVVLPRNFGRTKTFEKYAQKGVYGIVDEDIKNNKFIYTVTLTDCYANFLQYLLDK